jgi:hypothetical protein
MSVPVGNQEDRAIQNGVLVVDIDDRLARLSIVYLRRGRSSVAGHRDVRWRSATRRC